VLFASGGTFSGDVGNGNGAYGFDANRSDGLVFRGDVAAGNTFGGFFNILSTRTSYSANVATGNGGAPFGPLDQGEGFYLYETDATTMSANVASHNVSDGFQLQGATHTVITGNTSVGNQLVGFRLTDDRRTPTPNQSTGNTVSGNVGRGNGLLDAWDTGPAGSNTWSGNNFGRALLP
jgi:nitrous oxidase accessory protein NosD